MRTHQRKEKLASSLEKKRPPLPAKRQRKVQVRLGGALERVLQSTLRAMKLELADFVCQAVEDKLKKHGRL